MKGIPWAPFVSNNNYWRVTWTAALKGTDTTLKDKSVATAILVLKVPYIVLSYTVLYCYS